ncbi:MAG: hypothetical protein P8164_04490, partial [Gammaproteobacteria bacterium]
DKSNCLSFVTELFLCSTTWRGKLRRDNGCHPSQSELKKRRDYYSTNQINCLKFNPSATIIPDGRAFASYSHGSLCGQIGSIRGSNHGVALLGARRGGIGRSNGSYIWRSRIFEKNPL